MKRDQKLQQSILQVIEDAPTAQELGWGYSKADWKEKTGCKEWDTIVYNFNLCVKDRLIDIGDVSGGKHLEWTQIVKDGQIVFTSDMSFLGLTTEGHDALSAMKTSWIQKQVLLLVQNAVTIFVAVVTSLAIAYAMKLAGPTQ